VRYGLATDTIYIYIYIRYVFPVWQSYVSDDSIFGRRSISRAFPPGEDLGGSHLRVLPADATVQSEIYGPDALATSLKMSFCSLSRARGRNARTIYGRHCFSDARAAALVYLVEHGDRVGILYHYIILLLYWMYTRIVKV